MLAFCDPNNEYFGAFWQKYDNIGIVPYETRNKWQTFPKSLSYVELAILNKFITV
jgi:hypothetical protein